GHHESARGTALAGLSAASGDPLAPEKLETEQLEAEVVGNSWAHAATARAAWERIGPRLDAVAREPRAGSGLADWHVYAALAATVAAPPGRGVTARPTPAPAR